jgi:putative phosphoesterase
MKLAIVSDTHDHIKNTEAFVKQANEAGTEIMIHCGDLVSPFMLEDLDAYKGQIHLILGNNPGDQFLLARHISKRAEQVKYHGIFGVLKAGGINIGWVHEPQLAKPLVKSGEFNLVCFGHTHRWLHEKEGDVVVLNPGEVLGRKESPGWALVDTDGLKVKHMFLP